MTADAAVPDSLGQAEAVLDLFDVSGRRRPVNAADQADEPSDVLLAMVFGRERRWEVACEMVGDRLDTVRLCTLARFLR